MNGVLLDLGLSSDQLEGGAGFSFQRETSLDMRFGDSPLTAADIINTYDEEEIADIIYRFGEEPASRRIARRDRGRPPASDHDRSSQSRRAGRG